MVVIAGCLPAGDNHSWLKPNSVVGPHVVSVRVVLDYLRPIVLVLCWYGGIGGRYLFNAIAGMFSQPHMPLVVIECGYLDNFDALELGKDI
jgi:hypothetical protein